ncbi:hypothetical protein [Trinickia acidisoli]|uniref:hypothetical protein n=1 Tax=Trinickia acidisoli TaxID=2767482 RepID=UPI001A8FA7B8|nr:hypothetical protein [Trinickia acidisoli]
MPMIIDAMLAMSIGAIAIVQADTQAVHAAEAAQAAATGQYMFELQQAVNEYLTVNSGAIVNQLNGVNPQTIKNPSLNAITLTNNNPLAPLVSDLQNNGFMPAGYTQTNPSNLTFSVSITPVNCNGLGASGCQLQAAITSNNQYLVNGQVSNNILSYAVMAAGLNAAQSEVVGNNNIEFVSYGGAWTAADPNNLPGQLMIKAGSGTIGYVDTTMFYELDGSRALQGDMNANTHNITDVGTLSATTVNASGNASVTGTATIGSLSTFGDADIGGNVNTINGGSVNTFGGGVNTYGGTVDTTNNGTVNGTANTTFANVSQNLTVGSMATFNGTVQLPTSAVSGLGCGGPGQVATDSNGNLLTCQSNIWQAVSGIVASSNNYVQFSNGLIEEWGFVPGVNDCNCGITNREIVFNPPFPNNVDSLVLSAESEGTYTDVPYGYVYDTSLAIVGTRPSPSANVSDSGYPMYWVAFGH